MNPELMQIMDILMDEPNQMPDLEAVSTIIAGTDKPIALVQGLVYLLWLAAEKPEDFDAEIVRLMTNG